MAKKLSFKSISVNTNNDVQVVFYLPNPSAYVADLPDGGYWSDVTLTYWLDTSTKESGTTVIIDAENLSWPTNNTWVIRNISSAGTYNIEMTATINDSSVTIDPVVDDFTISATNKVKYMFRVGKADGHWRDFTDCLVAPNYKINNIPVTEEWEDANWTKHFVSPRKKIQGTLQMIFTTKERYYEFLDLLQKNEEHEDTVVVSGREIKTKRGPGIVKLKLQVNNELDTFSDTDYAERTPMQYIGLFNIKWEPIWFVPFIGTKEYDAIEIELEEA